MNELADWFHARCGMITASRIGDILADPQTIRYQSYRLKLANERITGIVFPEEISFYRNSWKGKDLETNAIGHYELRFDECQVTHYGSQNPMFIESRDIKNFGASPDATVDADGLIEVKVALVPDIHYKRIKSGFEGSKKGGGHMNQIQAQLLVTGREWVDAVSYCPLIPHDECLFVQRVERDPKYMARIKQAVIRFDKEVERSIRATQKRRATG